MFTFKGLHANNMGIKVLRLPPIKKASMRVETNHIEGSDRTVVEELGFQDYSMPCEIMVTDLSRIDEIIAWLSGSGVLIRDDDEDKFQHVSIYNEIDYNRLVRYRRATFEFYVADPFRYALNEDDVVLTEPGIVLNQGTYKSLPILTIEGSGEIEIDIDGRVFTYDFNTDTEVIIDSTTKNAYYPDEMTLKNRQMVGEFPYLTSGENNISWTGTVTQITIQPNSRWL